MTKLVAAALLTLSSVASAQTLVAVDAPPEKPLPRAVDARLGMLVGSSAAGGVDGVSTGISGGIGYRIGDVTIRGLADVYSVGDNADEAMHRHGRAERFGAAARYSFRNRGPDATFIADFWGEAGGGFEHIAWLHGGVLDRPSAELAFGVDLGHRGDRAHDHHTVGYFMDFRTLVGEAPAVPGEMATCSGPCTSATTPPRADLTMFFELGVNWGH
jgi:hypothetical protein